MAAETELYNALKNESDITDIVSDRIYSDIRDQGDTFPAIYYERTNTEYLHVLENYTPQGEKSSFILSCFETTREKAEALTALIITALSTAEFLCTDKQNSFDEEIEAYTTTIQLNFLEVT